MGYTTICSIVGCSVLLVHLTTRVYIYIYIDIHILNPTYIVRKPRAATGFKIKKTPTVNKRSGTCFLLFLDKKFSS